MSLFAECLLRLCAQNIHSISPSIALCLSGFVTGLLSSSANANISHKRANEPGCSLVSRDETFPLENTQRKSAADWSVRFERGVGREGGWVRVGAGGVVTAGELVDG